MSEKPRKNIIDYALNPLETAGTVLKEATRFALEVALLIGIVAVCTNVVSDQVTGVLNG